MDRLQFLFYLAVTVICFLDVCLINGYRVGENPGRRAELLDPRGKYQLEWMVDWATERITFNITVEAQGWILFGFSNNNSETTGRDIAIVGVGANGRPYLSDSHTGKYNVQLETDLSQDYTLNSYWQRGGKTFASFSRDLDTCDHQDYKITDNRVTLTWAYGENNDFKNIRSSDTVDEGSFEVYLLDLDFSPKITRRRWNEPILNGKDASTTKLWSVPQVRHLSGNETEYMCSIKKAPRLPRKHHLIGFDVSFDGNQSESLVHHLIMYKCNVPPNVDSRALFEPYANSDQQEICYSTTTGTVVQGRNMPIIYCNEPIYVWALGGRSYFTPDDVGYPFGQDPDEYYLLQVHYNNAERRSNLRVSLAIEYFYTQNLRPNEGALFTFGHDVPGLPLSFLVPPQTTDARMFAHCSPECTQRIIPDDGVTIVGGRLHAHMSSRKLRMRHFRRNQELPWIVYDDNYSNEFQQLRALRKRTQVLPGDQLSLDCSFDNTWTNGSVVGGYRTVQEMCIGYIVMYSKTRITDYSTCTSSIVSPTQRQRFLDVTNMTWYESQIDWVATSPSPRLLVGRTLTDISDNLIDWTPALRRELAQVHLRHPHVGRCTKLLHRRTPEEIRRATQPIPERELVLSTDYLPTSVNTESSYAGPASYPARAVPYEPRDDKCPAANRNRISRNSA